VWVERVQSVRVCVCGPAGCTSTAAGSTAAAGRTLALAAQSDTSMRRPRYVVGDGGVSPTFSAISRAWVSEISST